MTYESRTYRQSVAAEDLVAFEVAFRETDLQILAERDLSTEAADLIAAARWEVEAFISKHPRFAETLSPYDVSESAPDLIQRMAKASRMAQVGPMAAIAGMIAQHVAEGLSEHSTEVIVENGGDVYIVGRRERVVSVFAGDSGITDHVGIVIPPGLLPVSVCTSSGTVGHSLSFGKADAVVVIARDGALADAIATGLANRVQTADDIDRAVEAARQVMGILGVLVVVGDALGAWGNMRLVPLDGGTAQSDDSDQG